MAPNALTSKKTFPQKVSNLQTQVINLRGIVGSVLSHITGLVKLFPGGAVVVLDAFGNEKGRFGWNGTAVETSTDTLQVGGGTVIKKITITTAADGSPSIDFEV